MKELKLQYGQCIVAPVNKPEEEILTTTDDWENLYNSGANKGRYILKAQHDLLEPKEQQGKRELSEISKEHMSEVCEMEYPHIPDKEDFHYDANGAICFSWMGEDGGERGTVYLDSIEYKTCDYLRQFYNIPNAYEVQGSVDKVEEVDWSDVTTKELMKVSERSLSNAWESPASNGMDVDLIEQAKKMVYADSFIDVEHRDYAIAVLDYLKSLHSEGGKSEDWDKAIFECLACADNSHHTPGVFDEHAQAYLKKYFNITRKTNK